MSPGNQVLLCLLFLFSPKLLTGSTENVLLFSITSQNMARLGVINRCERNLNLEIADLQGRVLFSQTVQKEKSYFQLMDLSKMPDGRYNVKLTGNNENITRQFKVSNGKAEIILEAGEVPPSFQAVDNNTFGLIYRNTKNHVVHISFELNHAIIFEERNLTDAPLRKKYTLEKLPKGNYTIKMYAGPEVYTYSFKVD